MGAKVHQAVGGGQDLHKPRRNLASYVRLSPDKMATGSAKSAVGKCTAKAPLHGLTVEHTKEWSIKGCFTALEFTSCQTVDFIKVCSKTTMWSLHLESTMGGMGSKTRVNPGELTHIILKCEF